jgi:NADPH2:quinone reductase
MNAIRVSQTGGPEVLRYEELPTPAPGPGDALVRIEAVGVNYVDIYNRKGLYQTPKPPFIAGAEAAGVVEAVGPQVTDVKVGDRVASARMPGAYATHVAIPADRLVKVPDGVDNRTAAAVILQGLTAHYLTHSTYPVKAGETILLHAAAGGVGLLLTQMAKMLGARVIGTVSTEAKAALARQAGADEIILYTTQDFEAEVKRLTGGRGVPVVYESVGKTTFDKSLNCLSPRGYLVLFGQSSGPVPPFDPQILNAKGSLYLTRPTLGNYIATRDELTARANDVFGWVKSGRLKIRIDREFPLKAAADAHRYLESRQSTGKIILTTA